MMAKHISITGVVHDVGFRPFVYGLATRLDLHGWVCKTSTTGVEIFIQGNPSNTEYFLQRLTTEKPPQARIESMEVRTEESRTELVSFEILPSIDADDLFQPVPVDLAICPDCERELFDPRNRRYLYPFISCSHCGPRFSIIKAIPYDRPNTTMAEFEMCERCSAEYRDPLDRHFQAYSAACPDCGPFVALREIHSQFPYEGLKISSIEFRTSAILKARRLLREGYILGIKGLGGFHLVCDASNSLTVEELRDRKGRIDRPFALMASDLEMVHSICSLSREEVELLTSREKPIVVLERKTQNGQAYNVSKWVAPNLDALGIMLPYTPLHHLLLNQTDLLLASEPAPPLLVMTSGNLAEGPIATVVEDALLRLSPLVDAFILHDRDIHMRCDDSVVRVDRSGMGDETQESATMYLRRSRGYAPYTLKLPFNAKTVLAVGSEFQNAFCITRDRNAILSHQIGNMEIVQVYESFEQSVEHLLQLFQVQPEIIAHDLHPDYFSTQYVRRAALAARRVGVQHQHAHIAACMADNGLDDRRLIGLCFDRTGYGSDGAIWGGEVLLVSYSDFERFAHLEYLPLPGGDSAIRIPWRMAFAYAHALDLDIGDLPFLQQVDRKSLDAVRQQLDRDVNVPLNSSMGNLFEAVASLIGVRNESTYEAQAAIEMEVLAKPFVSTAVCYPIVIETTAAGTQVRLKELFAAIIQDVRSRRSLGTIAARFHQTVAEMTLELCRQARRSTGLHEVAISGGVWQNQILMDLVRKALRADGFSVYYHRQVPTNDSGLALGQAIVAHHSSGTSGLVYPPSRVPVSEKDEPSGEKNLSCD